MKSLSTVLLSAALLSYGSLSFANDDQLEQGKLLFSANAKPIACSVCHTLQDAGAVGTIGPDLDELKPDADRIRKTMMEGMGAMPSFADSLEEAEREAIIAYVLNATK